MTGSVRRLGLFGGSFDPIHRGHIDPVRRARDLLGLDRVLYLPTARPPHKQAPEELATAPAAARYAMVEMALLAREGLYASDLELATERPVYTIETLEHFARAAPEADLFLLVGADSFVQLESWRRWREIPDLARLVVLARPGWEIDVGALPPLLAERLEGGEITVVRDAAVDLSSTEIRQRLAAGGEPEPGWLPPLVVDYLDKYSFYASGPDGPGRDARGR